MLVKIRKPQIHSLQKKLQENKRHSTYFNYHSKKNDLAHILAIVHSNKNLSFSIVSNMLWKIRNDIANTQRLRCELWVCK